MITRSLAILVILAVSSTPALAKQCKEKRVKAHTGMYPVPAATKALATDYARQAWEGRCTQLYNGVWCDVGNAKSHKTVCNMVPTGIGSRKALCEFEAIPCRN
jgi:hypothetical protein